MPAKTLKPPFQNQLLFLRPGNTRYNFAAEQQCSLGSYCWAVARVVPGGPISQGGRGQRIRPAGWIWLRRHPPSVFWSLAELVTVQLYR